MKKFTSLLIGCSLALAGVAIAQQPQAQPPQEQQSPTTHHKQGAEKTHAAQAQPGTNAAKPEATATGRRAARQERRAARGKKAEATQQPAGATGVETQAGTGASPAAKQQVEQGRKGKKGRGAHAETAASPGAAAAGAATATASPGAAAAGQENIAAGGKGKAKKLDQQKVQQIKSQHANFRAQPKPEKVPAVTFNQNYRIQGSESWQGPRYQVFRSYHPEWHDEGWYRSHYPRVELIGGGYYYFNSGYWFPAWGYSPSAAYYVYDGPIYVGHRAEPPDQVIADVQAALQDMGYYKGEVDGLVGPLTREALAAYQADNGLTTTAAIDEPTLDSLGMG